MDNDNMPRDVAAQQRMIRKARGKKSRRPVRSGLRLRVKTRANVLEIS